VRFCGDTETSQEHLIADWATRTFAERRKPSLLGGVPAQDDGPTRLTSLGPHVPTAGVTCRTCNNGWIATLDRRTSEFAKPLVRGDAPVTLDPDRQTVLAAWLMQTAVVCDAAVHGGRATFAQAPALRGRDKAQTAGEDAATDTTTLAADPPRSRRHAENHLSSYLV